jgi:hypothetical protein
VTGGNGGRELRDRSMDCFRADSLGGGHEAALRRFEGSVGRLFWRRGRGATNAERSTLNAQRLTLNAQVTDSRGPIG